MAVIQKPHSTLYRYDVKFMDGEDWVGVEDHKALIARYNDLVEQLETYEAALREIELASRKPDTAPGHFGYIARVVLPESNPASEPKEDA